MKITRALLLSSKKQAEAWERTLLSTFLVSQYRTDYRYLVAAKDGDGFRLQIFRVSQRKHEDRTYNVLADEPHVEESFKDEGELMTFLREHRIDVEESWQPVEESDAGTR